MSETETTDTEEVTPLAADDEDNTIYSTFKVTVDHDFKYPSDVKKPGELVQHKAGDSLEFASEIKARQFASKHGVLVEDIEEITQKKSAKKAAKK